MGFLNRWVQQIVRKSGEAIQNCFEKLENIENRTILLRTVKVTTDAVFLHISQMILV